jgi:alkanesulfonate monooxygenase SsuD/methylene tetrahydromethanopterin reductase-like flavin-dependent oxidoreductase (luciferase family)
LVNVKYGCQLPQEITDFDRLVEIARECERLGYDSIWVYDHLSPFWLPSGQSFECWTLLSALAQRTKKIRLGTLVTNVNLRNPALLAKMSSTVDNISGGRLILGLGSGDRLSRNELISYGYGFASLEDRAARLRETILILKAMWNADETSFEGKFHRIIRAVNFPKPKQKPHPPIWIGGKHQKILDITAELAEGWNYWGLSSQDAAERSSYLLARCMEIGRNVEDITKSWAGNIAEMSQPAATDRIKKTLKRHSESGTRYFIAALGPRAEPVSYRLFAEAMNNLE